MEARGCKSGTSRGYVAFKIIIPHATNSIKRNPQYVSVNTTSATITLTTVDGAAAPAGYTVNSVLQCTVQATAPPGSDVFSVTLSDSSAQALWTNSATVVVTAGQVATAQT